MKKLTLNDKLDRVLLEATPEQLPALLDRFQLAVKYRTNQPAKKRKAKEAPAEKETA